MDSIVTAGRLFQVNLYSKCKPYAFSKQDEVELKSNLLNKIKTIFKEHYTEENFPPVPDVYDAWIGGAAIGLPYLTVKIQALISFPNNKPEGDLTIADFKKQLRGYSGEIGAYLHVDNDVFKLDSKSGLCDAITVGIYKNEDAYQSFEVAD